MFTEITAWFKRQDVYHKQHYTLFSSSMDSKSSKLVILLKTESDNDPYLKLLESHGFHGDCIPVLDFNYVNLSNYSKLLRKLRSYSGIVFTSQRAVHATQLLVESAASDFRTCDLQKIKCYTVGKATSAAAESLGFCPAGENSGNSESLAEFIAKDNAKEGERSILYPCGNIARDTLPELLSSQGFTVEDIVVYETVPKEDVSEEIQDCITMTKMSPGAIVIFSPSGVPVFSRTMEHFPLLSVQRMKIIAVGPTTESELKKYGIPVYGTLQKPDPQSLLDVLIS